MNDLNAPIQIFKHDNESYAFEFLNANTMATGSWDNTVKIWNITNGILIRTINIDSHVNCIKKERYYLTGKYVSQNSTDISIKKLKQLSNKLF